MEPFAPLCRFSASLPQTLRSVIVAVVAIALCFSISLLGLTTITTKVYGYMGYYSLLVVVLPAFIWGISKNRKLEAEHKEMLG